MSKLLENYLTLKNSFRDKSFSNTLLLISETFNVTPNQMMASGGRKRMFVQARNVLCYMMYSKLDYRLEEIAGRVGYKNHTSVMHAIQMHDVDLKFDMGYAEKYQIIVDNLKLEDPHETGVDFGNTEGTLKSFHYKILSIESRMEALEKFIN
jgi:chromosomal replication initiation ATPase DnaA